MRERKTRESVYEREREKEGVRKREQKIERARMRFQQLKTNLHLCRGSPALLCFDSLRFTLVRFA